MNIRTVVICCDELPDRKVAASAHLADRGVRATFWRAPHGVSWGLSTTREYEPGKRISAGHVSLDLAHWFAWQFLHQAWNPSDDAALILEDDAVLPPNWHAEVADLAEELLDGIPDWQFVFVGLVDQEPAVWHKITERVGRPDSRLCRLNDPFGTHAYLVRRSALPVLLDRCAVAERNMDQQLFARVLRDNHLVWCAVLPTLVEQRTYDHRGTGRPEWKPSCIDVPTPAVPPPPPASPGIRADVADAARIAGFRDAPRDGEPPAELVAATTLLTDPFPCIYRGESVDAPGASAAGKSVPLSVCAYENRLCHTRRGDVAAPGGARALECGTCARRVQMAPSGRPRLPVPDGQFNPSLALYNGELILATRDSWGHSRVALWRLRNTRPDGTGEWTAAGVGSYAAAHADAPRLEDPRLFVTPDPSTGAPSLCAMFNLPDSYPPKKVRVGMVRFARDLSGIVHTEVFESPHGNTYEKNWVPAWVESEDDLYWVYATKPEHVVLGRTSYATPNPFAWTGGVIRGGASPVLVTPEDVRKWGLRDWGRGRSVFYHFFHGCLKRVQGSVYTVGCVVFEARPPFQVMAQTPVPLLWPDLPGPGENVTKRFVCWPGGAVFLEGGWLLALGIDDTYSRIVRLEAAEVEKALTDRPEIGPGGVSIRDTPLARGVVRE